MKNKNIILLHGWGSSSKKLNPLNKELTKKEWKVLALKLPGFDLDPPREAWDITKYADYVKKEALKFYGVNKYFVFGHSFGGRITIRIASKGISRVLGVVLCSAAGISRPNFIKRLSFFFLAKVGKILISFETISKIGRKLLYRLVKEHDYERTEGIMKEVFKKIISENLREDIEKIKIPTLILWGRNDSVTPLTDANFINDQIKGSRLVVFTDDGHRLPYERAKEVAEEIEKWYKTL